MLADLALDLSVDTITLMQRQCGAWHVRAAMRCDDPQLSDRLRAAVVATRAVGSMPGAARCLIVLPADQIACLPVARASLPADPDAGEGRAALEQIAAGQSGAGAVRFDWRTRPDGSLRLAIVACDILREAEAFARAHGLDPAGTLAHPPDGFAGTPWFASVGDGAPFGIAPGAGGRDCVALPVAAADPAPDDTDTPARRRARVLAAVDPRTLDPVEDADGPAVMLAGRALGPAAAVVTHVRRIGVATLVAAIGVGAVVFWTGGTPAPDPGSTAAPAILPAAQQDMADARSDGAPVPTGPGMSDGLPDPADYFTPPPGLIRGIASQTLDDLVQPSLDATARTDALALAGALVPDNSTAPVALRAPPPPDQTFALGPDGLVVPTDEGAATPDGVSVFTGQPPRQPGPRPTVEIVEGLETPKTLAALPEDSPLKGLAPRPRPAGLIERHERANLGGRTRAELQTMRPRTRPASIGIAAAAVETALAEAAVAAAAAPTITAPSPKAAAGPAALRPGARPSDISTRAQARAAARAAPAVQPSDVARPTAQSSGTVTKRATVSNRMNLSDMNLLGTFGSSRQPRALVRLPGGRVVNVSVGDRLDGGRVAAIQGGRLDYVKQGRKVTLAMPRG